MMSDDYDDDNGEDSVPVKTKIKKKAKDKNKGGLAVKTKKKTSKKKAPGGTGEFAAKLTGQKIGPEAEKRIKKGDKFADIANDHGVTTGTIKHHLLRHLIDKYVTQD